MDYICPSCFRTTTAAGNCNHCNVPKGAVKEWNDYKGNVDHSCLNYNPSTRHVAFDCNVNTSANEVYVVVKLKINWERATASNFAPQRPTPPNWTNQQKQQFIKRMKAAVSLWDRNVTFRNGTTNYTPLFFVEIVTRKQQASITARSTEDEYNRIGTQAMAAGAAVTMAPPYKAKRPVPGNGKVYDVSFICGAALPRMTVLDTSVGNAHKSYFCAMPHEYGHLLGLPDEYDLYPNITTNNVPKSGATGDVKQLCVIFWAQLLKSFGIAVPAWGQYGTGMNQVADHSLMRDAHSLTAGFKPRHFVTVKEALDYISVKKMQGVPWEIV